MFGRGSDRNRGICWRRAGVAAIGAACLGVALPAGAANELWMHHGSNCKPRSVTSTSDDVGYWDLGICNMSFDLTPVICPLPAFSANYNYVKVRTYDRSPVDSLSVKVCTVAGDGRNQSCLNWDSGPPANTSYDYMLFVTPPITNNQAWGYVEAGLPRFEHVVGLSSCLTTYELSDN